MKTAMLLTDIDKATYSILQSPCTLDKPATKKFNKSVQMLTNHPNLKSIEVMERCTFHRAKQ